MADQGYIKSLDGVRAIAIILVMTFHATLTEYGWIGVQLFFVLSGFLITGILWKEKTKPESLGYKLKKFWVRRSLRIFPLYYGYVLVIALAYLFFQFPPYFKSFYPYLLTYTSNFPLELLHSTKSPLFNHLWSLSIEEQFYLLFPLIILVLPQIWTKRLLVAILLLSPLLRYGIGEFLKSKGMPAIDVADGVNFNTLCQLDAFCTGGIIHVLSLQKKITKPAALFSFSLLLLLAAGVFNYNTSDSTVSYWKDLGFSHYFINNYQHVWHYTLLNFCFAAFLLLLVSKHSPSSLKPVQNFLEAKWMVKIGRVSYGMYLFHWLIWVYVFMKIFNPQSYLAKLALFVPYLIFVYFISELSFRFYEIHFINMKDRFFPSSDHKTRKPTTQSVVVRDLVKSE